MRGGMRTCVAGATGSLRVDKKQTPRKWGVCFWPTRQDSNLRPSESESDALSSCATGRYALYCSTVFCKSKPLNAFFSFFAQRLSLTRFCPGKVFSAFRYKSLDEMPDGRYNTTVKKRRRRQFGTDGRGQLSMSHTQELHTDCHRFLSLLTVFRRYGATPWFLALLFLRSDA